MKKKILFIQLTASSFVRKDEELLKKHFDVHVFCFKHRKGIRIIPELIRQLFFLLKGMSKAKLVYVWFADFHAVLPVLTAKLFGKKSVIVIGGVDAAYDPVLKYGTKNKLAGRLSLYISTFLANQLLPVTSHTKNQLLRHVSSRLENKSTVIHNCFDQSFNTAETKSQHRKGVISICLAENLKTLRVKGIDFLLQVAESMPETSFTIVGIHGEALQWVNQHRPSNVQVIAPVPHSMLIKHYHSAAVICQFSRHESFGVALLEGIAAGCFPVGHQTGGIAEILTGSAGILIHQLEVSTARKAILEALEKTETEQQGLAQKLIQKFTCENRENQLIHLLKTL